MGRVTSDENAGLKARLPAVRSEGGAASGAGEPALAAVQFPLQHNAQVYVPKPHSRSPVAAHIRALFEAPDAAAPVLGLAQRVARYRRQMPQLAQWMEENLPQGLAGLALPTAHRQRLRRTNALERVNKESRRRIRVGTRFASEHSCLRLVSAVLMEISQEWERGRVYLSTAD